MEGCNAGCEASPSESCDKYVVLLTNLGSRASEGQITVKGSLPAGLDVERIRAHNKFMEWERGTEELGVPGRSQRPNSQARIPAGIAQMGSSAPVSRGERVTITPRP
jgi:hypothetical protein